MLLFVIEIIYDKHLSPWISDWSTCSGCSGLNPPLSPRRTPTPYFVVSGRASRCYTLLKGDLEVVVAKGNLIIPRQNSTTGYSLESYPGHIIIMCLFHRSVLISWFICHDSGPHPVVFGILTSLLSLIFTLYPILYVLFSLFQANLVSVTSLP